MFKIDESANQAETFDAKLRIYNLGALFDAFGCRVGPRKSQWVAKKVRENSGASRCQLCQTARMRALEIDLSNVVWLKVQEGVSETNFSNFAQPNIPVDAARTIGIHGYRLTLTRSAGSEACGEAGYIGLFGSVAQWIEQRFPKPCVVGSIPIGATKNRVSPTATPGLFCLET